MIDGFLPARELCNNCQRLVNDAGSHVVILNPPPPVVPVVEKPRCSERHRDGGPCRAHIHLNGKCFRHYHKEN